MVKRFGRYCTDPFSILVVHLGSSGCFLYILFAFLYFRLFALVYLLLFILGTTSLKKCFLSGIARITSPPTQILATCRNFVKKHHHEVTTGWISVVKVKRDTKSALSTEARMLWCNCMVLSNILVESLRKRLKKWKFKMP